MVFSKVARLGLKFYNKFNLYTKKQCVDISINIGKELIDAQKTGTKISKELLNETIKKYVPKYRTQIIRTEEECANFLESLGYSKEGVKKVTECADAINIGIINKGKRFRAIYVPSERVSFIAHEFEHYMHDNHTLLSNLLFNYFATGISKIKNFFKPAKNVSKETKNGRTPLIQLVGDIQRLLFKMFGILDGSQIYKGVKPTNESINKFFSGSDYIGLTSEKRINAYIRGIIRGDIHPKNKNSTLKLRFLKSVLEDEGRAYHVTDVLERYEKGFSDVSGFGLRSNIFLRAANILKDEIRLSLRNIFKRKQKPIQTGLPAKAYCGENVDCGGLMKKLLENARSVDAGITSLVPYKGRRSLMA